ncbi:proline-rich domain-containing protein [Steroidobacter cummioxidans]|uniref:proline-rich domain-containing protein n=1 Tax=Steroidobacter cummioxidans TaxID=1803913 RepID=UPI00129032D7|nr:IPT/TIG domain-containing protein [Steroidobacter cummioxidans]
MRCHARWSSVVVGILYVSLLSACGGGGGGSGGEVTPPPSSGNPNTPPPSGNPDTPPPSGDPNTPGESAGSFTVSSESLSFVSMEDDEWRPLPSQTITMNVTGRERNEVYYRTVVDGSAIEAYLTVDGSVEVRPILPYQLDPGLYSATVTIRACAQVACTQELEGSPKIVNVTYERRGLKVSVSPLEFTVRNGASTIERTRSFTVTGYPEQTWFLDTAQSWLTLSRASGSTADPMPVEVVVDESGGLLKNGVYRPTLRLVGPTQTKYITVNVNIDRTEVHTVAPYLGVLFGQREVIVRGANFNAADVTGVQFGGVDATSFNIVSASEIRATTPGSLGTGSHAITLTGNAASALSDANFKVVAPAPYVSTHLPLPSGAATNAQPSAIAYDAVGQRIFVAVDQPEGTRDFVARYTYQPIGVGSWARANAYTSYNSLKAMTLALDGETLLLSEAGATWSGTDGTHSGMALSNLKLGGDRYSTLHRGWTDNFISSIAAANDGRAVMVSAAVSGGRRPVYRYSSLSPVTDSQGYWGSPSLEQVVLGTGSEDGWFDNGVAGAAGDGSRVLIASSAAAAEMYEYDSATSTLRRIDQVMQAGAIQLDRTGGRILLNNTHVYDRDFQLLGQLPATTIAAVFSPNLPRIYAYDSTGQLSSYDLTGTSVTPIRSWSPTASAGDPQRRVVMTITAEGWTLLIAGTNGVLVEYIPDNAR